jgi:GNAT superfamily N-acetyltransferase
MKIIWPSPSLLGPYGPVPWRERLQGLIAREGLSGILRMSSRRLLSHIFDLRRATVFDRCLNQPIPECPPSMHVTLREMTLEDLKRFREPESYLRERRIINFARQLKTGRTAVIVLADDRVAGYGWLSLENVSEQSIGVEVSLEEGEGYIYDGFIFPSSRGRRIYPSLIAWRLNWLRRHGCKTVYSIVFTGNQPAVNWHQKMGFRNEQRIYTMSLLGLKWRMNHRLNDFESPRY